MAGGLSTDKLDELRKQREEARAKKKAEEEKAQKEAEEKARKEQEEKLRKEQEEKAKREQEEKARAERINAENARREQERKAELARIEKEKQELKAQLEKEKQEKLENQKRHNEELAKEKEKQIEILKEEKRKVEQEKEKSVQEKNEEINQLKQEKKSAEEKLAEKEKSMLEKIRKEQEMLNEASKNDIVLDNEDKDFVYASKVKVVDNETEFAENFSELEEEDGKVQIGYTMVDKSLVSEAKDNKRYGIKERGPMFRKLNNIVFYLAIPFMIVWAVLAFGGVCTAKVGYTSFANSIYYKVNEETAVSGYKEGIVLTVKAATLSDVKKNDVICIEFRNKVSGVKELHLVTVTNVTTGIGSTARIITFTIDNNNNTLSQYNIVAGEESNLISSKDVNFMGIVAGRDIIIGSFLMLCQNIVGFVFIVLIPASIILTFQFINLYDSIRFFVKQRKIAKSNKPKPKQEDTRDKIKR